MDFIGIKLIDQVESVISLSLDLVPGSCTTRMRGLNVKATPNSVAQHAAKIGTCFLLGLVSESVTNTRE